MTVYELAKSLPAHQLDRLCSVGLVSRALVRQLHIYELYLEYVKRGLPRMQVYTDISETCYTSEENVRKIIRKFCEVVK